MTAVSIHRLRGLNQTLVGFPDGFEAHRKIGRARERRGTVLNDLDEPSVDWAAAQELALASILEDGVPICPTGEDVERGTFSQRHSVFYDARSGRRYVPLQSLSEAKPAFEVHNSPLTENATSGFEFGYNVQAPGRLVIWEAQYGDFILTTFNEVDMGAVLDLRKRHNPEFEEKHGIPLGIVSFFVKATIGAFRDFPRLNAEVQGEEILIKRYYDIGVAVGAPEGLVVPVLRNADRLPLIEIDKAVKDFAARAREKRLSLEDIQGGTFTISNGGVFASLLSTPLLNPPQVGVLALHKIEQRPYVIDGAVEVRPLMYVALSYDHRIVDGLEAVQFLGAVKALIEDPEKLLLEG